MEVSSICGTLAAIKLQKTMLLALKKVVDWFLTVGAMNFMSLRLWREGWYNPTNLPAYGPGLGEAGKEVLGSRWRSTWERMGKEAGRLDEGGDQLVGVE